MMDYRELLEWEGTLRAGDTVEARWYSSYVPYHARASIVKVNAKSFRVRILQYIGGDLQNYPIGWELLVPRTADWHRWSWGFGVFPVDQEVI